MAVPLANTLEGGSDGTTITTGNSGGASGNAFDAVGISATHTLTYENSPVMSQALCAVNTPGGTSGTAYVQWAPASVGTIGPTVYTRCYWRNIGSFLSNSNRFQYMEGAASTSHRCDLQVGGTGGSPGRFTWVNAAGTSGTLSTNTLSVDTTYRFECLWTLSTTVGQVVINCYLGDSTTPLETLTSPATQNFGGTTMDTISWGNVATSVTSSTQAPAGYDGLAIGTTGYFGPVSTGQIILPDADTVTTGWTTAPLFSKVNDSSDATVITATAS